MRTLLINLGNTTAFVGIGRNGSVTGTFRLPIAELGSASGFKRAFAGRIRGPIHAAAVSSVVPGLTAPVCSRIRRAFGVEPKVLHPCAEHGLTIEYRTPSELGSDRLAAALGAQAQWPGRPLLVVDCGTATTVTALGAGRSIRGGAILPGFGLWSQILEIRTARLPRVAAGRPRSALGRSPGEAIVSGNFYGHLGAIRELVTLVRKEAFGRSKARVVATGGYAALFKNEGIFDWIVPDLVLRGLLVFAQTLGAPRLKR